MPCTGHGAANVTLGIPRLREIVMTASRKPKTPSMTMTMRHDIPVSAVDAFCKKATRLTMSQIVDTVTVKETLAAIGGVRTKAYTVDLTFYPKTEYESEYDVEPSEILAAFGTKFPLILKKEVQTELKKLDQDLKTQMANVGKGKAVARQPDEAVPGGDADESSGEGDIGKQDQDDDELSEVGDGDATSAKRKRQSKEQTSYDDEDSEDGGLDAYNDAALEAAYASHQEEDAEESDDASDLATELGAVEEMFLHHFPRATSFNFSASGCKIGVEVCFDIVRTH